MRYFFLLIFLRLGSGFKIEDDDIIGDILFGVSTSAYQIEGAVDEDGRGVSIWDDFIHNHTNTILDNSNADVACDSYHQLDRDLKMIQELGVDVYRFSISWPRILPTGFTNVINQKGIAYYRRLLDGLKAMNVTPIVTIYHWELPQNIQNLGGWANEATVDYVVDFARILFDTFGDSVPIWITINEGYQICQFGYGSSIYPPYYGLPGFGEYLCTHNLIKAHAKIYHLYKDKYKKKYNGIVGMIGNAMYMEPASQSAGDVHLAQLGFEAQFGWQMNAVYSPNGDYPKAFKDKIAQRSAEGNFSTSRLPEFTKSEIEYIRGAYDFLGLNYFNTRTPIHVVPKLTPDNIGFLMDMDMELTIKEGTETPTVWIRNYPEGLRKTLNYIRTNYNNPPVFITENGATAYPKELDNQICTEYLRDHIQAVFKAIKEDGCNIKLYAVWSLMDNFEWFLGYKDRFGLYQTDFEDPLRRVTPRTSAKFYRNLISQAKKKRTKTVDEITGIKSHSPAIHINLSMFITIILAVIFHG